MSPGKSSATVAAPGASEPEGQTRKVSPRPTSVTGEVPGSEGQAAPASTAIVVRDSPTGSELVDLSLVVGASEPEVQSRTPSSVAVAGSASNVPRKVRLPINVYILILVLACVVLKVIA